MIICRLTILCNHHHYLVLEYFHYPTANPVCIKESHPSLLHPQAPYQVWLIHSLIDKHLGYFLFFFFFFLAVVDKAATSICVYVFCVDVSFHFSWIYTQNMYVLLWLPHFIFLPKHCSYPSSPFQELFHQEVECPLSSQPAYIPEHSF